MRYSLVQFCLILLLMNQLYAASASAQEVLQRTISLNVKDTEIKTVLSKLESIAAVKFVYSSRSLPSKRKVTIALDGQPLGQVLDKLFSPDKVSYQVLDGQIILHMEPDTKVLPNGTGSMDADRTSTPLDRNIGGKVQDESGNPLPGVSVVLKGTTRGTSTGSDGAFRLEIPDGATTLIFSFVGYISREIELGNRTNLDIKLVVDNKALEEVVVVGYGSQRKRDITSAVSVINMDDIGEVPASNVTRLIQGQAPGVVIKQKDGSPGSAFEVRVRGIGSLGAGSDPLYVIDGFAVGTSVGQNLNPNDIESISILKDAASTAIYGARGSNGVVLITTKSAKEGKVSLNFKVDYGVQNIPQSRRVKVLNGVEFAQFKKEVFMDGIRYFQNREPAIEEVPIGYRFPEQTKYSTDWFGTILDNNAPYTDYNLTLSSGQGPIKSTVSAGYYSEKGSIINTNYDRYSVRTNLGGKVNRFITMGLNINGTYSTQNLASTNGRSALVGSTLIMDPREPVYNEDGSIRPYIGGVDGVFGFPNPLFVLQNTIRKRNVADILSNAFLEFTLLEGLKFRSSVNAKLNYNNYREFIPSSIGTALNGFPPRIATGRETTDQLLNLSTDQLLSYTPKLGTNHQLDMLVGFNAQEEKVKGVSGSGNTFPDDLVPYLGAAIIRSSDSYEYSWTMLAYLARANYAYKDKYLLSASMRREGSSRFGALNKYGNFPAFSVGWRISEESFIPKTNWLTDMKLRASWGKTGNNNIGNYSHLAFMNTNNYILGDAIAPGKIVSSFANTALEWEKSSQLDIGLDLAILDNKLVFTVEYYKRITNDMLLPISIPSVSGFTSSLANIGKVQNQGLELAIDYRTRIAAVNFKSNFNISINRNKILAIKGANDMLWTGGFYGGYNVQKVGRPIGMIYGYNKLGIFNTQSEIDAAPRQDGVIPGGMRFEDTNGDGVITYDTQDMVEIGNPNPKFTWGWTVAADYRKFDINVLFMGAHKFDVYRNIEASTMNMDGVFNVLDKAKDRWRSAENPGTNPQDVHAQGGTNYFKWSRESSNRYVYDASHVWLKNVSIGYTLPNMKSFLSNARVYVNAANLFLITKYPGNNPDAGVRSGNNLNNDDESYPVPRTFSAGINLTF
jgi:TonB-linked SusC/RagA family outer membrane protein